MEPFMRTLRTLNPVMVILCLVAVGLSVTVVAFAFRRVGEGYQDELGFHNDHETGSDSR
jgi:hypothetical protein